jgi:membrane-associated PAP2 superfamily phosphatase
MIDRIDGIRARIATLATGRPVVAAALLTAIVSLIAVVLPSIDLAVSRLFFHPGVDPTTTFPLENQPFLLALRRAGMGVTRWAAVLLVLAVLAKILVPMLARAIPTRALLYVLATLAAGPGLLINVFFKELWSRPRPIETTIFGGDWRFQPAWVLGGDCPTNNCSFPSGEAASAAWLVGLVFVVPERFRRATLVVTVGWTAAISFNRVIFGSHFLSDVAISWCLIATVLLALRELVLVRMPQTLVDTVEAFLARLGEIIVAPFRPKA